MNELEPFIAVAITLAVLSIGWLLFVFIITGGSLGRYWLSRRLARRWLRDKDFAGKVDALARPAEPAKSAKPSPEPIRLLGLLQREGRLLDFLLEDVAAASDADLGAGVREIHRQCQKVLREHLTLAPVIAQEENTTVEVAAGFDPSAIRLTGNVTGAPPFKGTLIHRGWRVVQIKLGPLADGMDHLVLQPAEVELP